MVYSMIILTVPVCISDEFQPGIIPGYPHKGGTWGFTHKENGGDSQEERGSKEEAWGKWRDILTKPGGLGITHKENGGDS